MPNTPVLGLPYPASTDPLANMAAAIQALATAVESIIPGKIKRGHTVATTDAAGDLTITHGLGATPFSILATVSNNNGSNWTIHIHTQTSTTFKARFRIANTGALVASTSVAIDWLVSL